MESLLNNSSCVQRRIKREIEQLINLKICLPEQVNIQQNIDQEYIVAIQNLSDNKDYEFKMSNYHPFRPPKLLINKKLINFTHKQCSEKFGNSLIKYTGIECFCCETILCSNNWSPQFTCKDIINDIQKYRDARHQVVIRIIVDVIKRKYLVDDINIIEWLY
jgi:ubiquitin-protein ligase